MANEMPPSYNQAMDETKKGETNLSFDGDLIHRSQEIPIATQPESQYFEEQRTVRTSNGHTQIYVVQSMGSDQGIHFRYPQRIYCDQCQRTAITRTTEAAHAPLSFLLCFTMFLCGCWPCCFIPFCCRYMRDIEHYCGNPSCGRYIGTYRAEC